MTIDDMSYELQVVNAFKSYGEKKVLNGLNMNVESGTIYGLLGASGCGKSTLLQCVLGTLKLSSGRIDLRVKKLKEIGYMPQDLCLETTLTVKEMFEYYGSLYSMKKRDIEDRIYELTKFLPLQNFDSYIRDLSGGQCRRVSMIIALLHNPKFIILDEPTVGIDPLLRNEIWDEFAIMVDKYKKTIIITTHYIEEASKANRVGLMRHGILVKEESPETIISESGTSTLEESFLKLCYNQKSIEGTHFENVCERIRVPDQTQSDLSTKAKNNISLHRVKALLNKNFRVFSREYVLLVITTVIPLLQMVIYCTSIGASFKEMSIAIKNDEVNILDCQFSDTFGCILDDNNNQTMSCVIVNYLTSLNYQFVVVNDHEAGKHLLDVPNHMAFLYFPKNYTIEMARFIDDRENYANETYVHLTMENFLFRNQIKMHMFDAIQNMTDKLMTDCSRNPKSISASLEFSPIYGGELKSQGSSTVSIVIAKIIFFYISVFSTSMMMSEKMDGVLNRSILAGVKVLELVISMFSVSTVISLFQILSVCFICFGLFPNPIQITSGLIWCMVILLLLSWTGFLFGLLTAVLVPTKIGGIYVAIGATLSQIFLSGIIWPVEGQPRLLRVFSELLPITVVGKTMNNILLKGWTLGHSSVITGITIIFAYDVLLVLVLIILGKLIKDLWIIKK